MLLPIGGVLIGKCRPKVMADGQGVTVGRARLLWVARG